MSRDRSYLFIESCLNEWQSVQDLVYILQCDCDRTVYRYINTFRLMVETHEITKYNIEIKRTTTSGKGSKPSMIRISEK